ncbi:MAG TPA: aldose epimerase family protein [Steroidobacteraceae bacterium]|nr:aldose epimerase family protein [Steroidobacteraceae bacterium]
MGSGLCMGGGSGLVHEAIVSDSFGQAPGGVEVARYTLTNRAGMRAQILTYGGIVSSLSAPDRQGRYEDVVLGFDGLADYVEKSPYFGAIIGRYANRIAQGRFELDGEHHTLALNDPPNSLHGGRIGFDKVVWGVTGSRVTPAGPELTLRYVSRHGEEGYPGNLAVEARYTLTEDDALGLVCEATTDRATVVNLTQHSYFNLHGVNEPHDVLDHLVQINATRFTPIDATLVPTGELRSVANTALDFREPRAIGERIGKHDPQLELARGYDHNYVLDGAADPEPPSGLDPQRPSAPREPAGLDPQPRRGGDPRAAAVAARVYEPVSGRVLELITDQPGLQFYTGNFLDGSLRGKGGLVYGRRSGFCLEAQHFPNSPNETGFPSTLLEPGEVYRNTIIYRFRTR